MKRRALYIADGPSDLALARHLETLCAQAGVGVEVVRFPADRLGTLTVRGRLEAILPEDPDFELLFVHRDSEHQDPAPRFAEVADAVTAVGFAGPSIAVVPVRMTEAWLLLDEQEIRAVAGKPGGTGQLGLPALNGVERLADPKQALREALVAASGLAGRRLKLFRKQFSTHRRLLLERLDPAGQVRQLAAWQRLESDVAAAVTNLPQTGGP